jgi:sodium/potassium-transporting ATPase subunit alpha
MVIEYGCLVFDNLKKPIIYILPAGSFSKLWPVLLNVFFGLPQILSGFYIIIICTLTDCVGASTLVFEKPEANLFSRPPRHRKNDRLANGKLIILAYEFVGVIECVTAMAMAFWSIELDVIPFLAWVLVLYPPQYDPDTLVS